MRSILLFLGLGGIGYGLYNYFTKQLDLALDWDFKIKDFNIKKIDTKGAEIDLMVSVLNKSSFALLVKNYDINIKYADTVIANAINDKPFTIQGESWFDVPTTAVIKFSGSTGILDDLGLALLTNKPIYVDVMGDMNVQFGKLPKQVKFNVKDVLISKNITKDVGLTKPIDGINKFLDKLGIKI